MTGPLRATAGGAAVLIAAVWSPATEAQPAPADLVWYQAPFEQALEACRPPSELPACAEWFAAIDAARPKVADLAAPEWHRLTFERALGICTGLRTPDWCPDWQAAMRAVTADPVYKEAAAAKKATVDAAAAAVRAVEEARQALLRRIRTRAATPADIVALKARGDAGDGEALELLGWMYAKGYGVDMDFVRAYEYYGAAVLAGRESARENLKTIWPYLNDAERRLLVQRFAPPPSGSQGRP